MVRDSKLELRELKRGFTFDRASVDVANRRVDLAFSSESPYERSFGMEVLGHGPGEVDLTRLADGTHPLLLNHDRDKQIGVIESAGIGGDKKGRAKVRFSKSALGEEIFQDVLDGIRSQASVAYEVRENDWQVTREEGKPEVWRATKWTPFEVSIVSIAADPSVGVGKNKQSVETNLKQKDNDMDETNKAALEQETQRKIEAARKDEREKADREAKEKAENERNAERTRISEIHSIGRMYDMAEEAEKAVADGTSLLDFRGEALKKFAKNPKAIAVTETTVKQQRTIGEEFIERAKESKTKFTPGDRINLRINMDERNKFVRATFSTSGLTSITDLPGIVVPDRRVLRVADLFPQGSISTSQIRWVKESSFTNAATRVAEGAEKPEATLAVEQDTATVEKTAVVLKVTDEMLADWAVMSSYIDNALVYMVQALEDSQLLTGTGSSQILGLLNVTGIQTTSAAAADTPADAFHRAITLVRDIGNTEPNYFIVNPYDYENLKITKDTSGQYYGGGPFTGPYGVGQFTNVQNLWGLPAVITSAMTRGSAICGNFAIGAMIFRRTGLTLETTNSNEDDFNLNLISLRAEQRMLLATWKPKAFCEITNIPA